MARERRLELADGDIEAKVALRLEGLTVATPDGARKLIAIDRLADRAPATAWPCWAPTAPASRPC